MFTSEMIAPCGLDCSLCGFAHAKEKPCLGCNAPGDTKPAFCASWCRIVPCEKRRKNGYRFCDECPDYPCEEIKEKEKSKGRKKEKKDTNLEIGFFKFQ